MTGNIRGPLATIPHPAVVLLTAALLLAAAAPGAQAGPLERAQAAAAKQDWATATDEYVLVLQKDPAQRVAAIGLVEAAVKAGKTDTYAYAEDALLGIVAKNGQDWDARIALGEICLALSASKADTLAKKSYDAQALENFQAALAGRPDSDAAAAGLARTYYNVADFAAAEKVVDDFLAARPAQASRALFWKGQAIYLQAVDAFRAAGNTYPLSPAVQALFRKAQGAYQASAAAGTSSYETWLQLAYASAYLGDRGTALEGYTNAAVADPRQSAPLRGLEVLHSHDAQAWRSLLDGFLAKHPKHEQALWYAAFIRYNGEDWRGAMGLFERYAKVARAPAEGWYRMGLAASKAGEIPVAENAFYEALSASPDHAQAAEQLDKAIRDGGAMRRAQQSLENAYGVLKQYAPILKAAPRNPWVRNNVGFILREAYVAHQGSASWVPILKASAKNYVEASEILGDWTAEKENTYNWGTRYAEAQIISDTGLMFQFYKPTEDFEKAEMYYRLALEYTDTGYRDAFNNLTGILAKQERWQDLYDLAADGAEGITTEDGQPDTATRNRARGIMRQLLADGKAKD